MWWVKPIDNDIIFKYTQEALLLFLVHLQFGNIISAVTLGSDCWTFFFRYFCTEKLAYYPSWFERTLANRSVYLAYVVVRLFLRDLSKATNNHVLIWILQSLLYGTCNTKWIWRMVLSNNLLRFKIPLYTSSLWCEVINILFCSSSILLLE